MGTNISKNLYKEVRTIKIMVILTKLKNDDFRKILENYDIGNHISHKHINKALQNTVYLVKTSTGRYILKIFEDDSTNFIKFQLGIIDFLKSKIPIQGTIKTNQHKSIFKYQIKGNKKRIVIYDYITGANPLKLTSSLIKHIAQVEGIMNKNLLGIPLNGKHIWKENYQLNPNIFEIKKVKNLNLHQEALLLSKQLKRFGLLEIRRSVTHGDFNQYNLIAKKNKIVAVIDWGDTHEDFLVQEVSTTLADLFKIKTNKRSIKLFLKTYQKYIKLSNKEKRIIYYLMKHRILGAINWHAKQLKIHKNESKRLEKDISKLIKQYNDFKNTTLEDFLTLF